MVNYMNEQLNLVFAALADTTRRAVLERLGAGPATISELAEPHGMSLPGFMKHLAVLQAAGLIERAKEGRVVRCELDAQPMQAAASWIAQHERFWNQQLDALGRYLHHQEELTPCQPPKAKPRNRSASTATTPLPSKRSGKPGPTRKR